MLTEWQEWIEERWRKDDPGTTLLVNIAGLTGEAGEVAELVKKQSRDGRYVKSDMLLELGDVLHYLTAMSHRYGFTLEDIMEANMDKVNKRRANKDGFKG